MSIDMSLPQRIRRVIAAVGALLLFAEGYLRLDVLVHQAHWLGRWVEGFGLWACALAIAATLFAESEQRKQVDLEREYRAAQSKQG
ncbi:MAG: hypothetical protein ABSG52_11985 [Terriglobales bacterium]